jgi:hypothetical protein
MSLRPLEFRILDYLALLIQQLVIKRILARLLASLPFAPFVHLLLGHLKIKTNPPPLGIKNNRFALRIALAHRVGSLKLSVLGETQVLLSIEE